VDAKMLKEHGIGNSIVDIQKELLLIEITVSKTIQDFIEVMTSENLVTS
jgi:hypothetical protein